MQMKRLVFDVCELDAQAIEKALSMRQGLGRSFGISIEDVRMHDDENTRGMLLGEVCRGWTEWIDSLGASTEESE